MKKTLYLFCFLFFFCFVSTSAQSHKLLFETPYGNFKVLLYDFTPNHRDLILNAIKTDVYQNALFNRVIENFVVQGGEHDIDIEKREAADPMGHKPRLSAEFDQRAYHKMGALGAGRDNNLEKASFLNQIYFVVGKPITESELDALEQKKKLVYTAEQRTYYLQNGGQPRLDNDFTVFGEVYEGLDVLINMSKTKTDKGDFPIKKIPFQITEIKE
ncbi:peptidylprolyl isomerase [Sphingobacterium wenxiniae]|uniref:peptidylprolyl isomerase n=1 Tax=Sphingobacterium wenxiniae TaxID=683125 RepID=A0A1I6QQR9_9SPHI|nr:peptidylprolyl isomerase [Sphingobacterium wenxiniae]SFS54712.1 peptidyl-prolyl cis-trans isomerase B (cyclophilin B) [Sphingobacterium wenxiniae]